MILARVSSPAAFKETARFGRRGSAASCSMPGMMPDVETVIRFGAIVS